MTDSREVNQQYLWTWLSNTEDVYTPALEIAEGGDVEALREFITDTLRAAPKDSVTGRISQEMTTADMATIDWDDIRACLVS